MEGLAQGFSFPGRAFIDGSRTKEFDVRRVLGVGTLYLFFFILVMEGLSLTMCEVCEHHLFQCISLSNSGFLLSHLMYTNDITFIGELSNVNFVNLNRILKCFYLTSVLKKAMLRLSVLLVFCVESPLNFIFIYIVGKSSS